MADSGQIKLSELKRRLYPDAGPFWAKFSRMREELRAGLPPGLRAGVPPKAFLSPGGCRTWYRLHLVAEFAIDANAMLSIQEIVTHEDVDLFVIWVNLRMELSLREARAYVGLSTLIWPNDTEKNIWLYEVEAELSAMSSQIIGQARALPRKIEEVLAIGDDSNGADAKGSGDIATHDPESTSEEKATLSNTKSGDQDCRLSANRSNGCSDPQRVPDTEFSGEAKTKKKRGRPAKISIELKEMALHAATGKARAQILYQTRHPSSQQVKNVSSILRYYKRNQQSTSD